MYYSRFSKSRINSSFSQEQYIVSLFGVLNKILTYNENFINPSQTKFSPACDLIAHELLSDEERARIFNLLGNFVIEFNAQLSIVEYDQFGYFCKKGHHISLYPAEPFLGLCTTAIW